MPEKEDAERVGARDDFVDGVNGDDFNDDFISNDFDAGGGFDGGDGFEDDVSRDSDIDFVPEGEIASNSGSEGGNDEDFNGGNGVDGGVQDGTDAEHAGAGDGFDGEIQPEPKHRL